MFGIYTNSGALSPRRVLQTQIHYHNIQTQKKKIDGGSREGGFYLSFCYGLQIESDTQYPDYLLSMKTKEGFFLFSFL